MGDILTYVMPLLDRDIHEDIRKDQCLAFAEKLCEIFHSQPLGQCIQYVNFHLDHNLKTIYPFIVKLHQETISGAQISGKLILDGEID